MFGFLALTWPPLLELCVYMSRIVLDLSLSMKRVLFVLWNLWPKGFGPQALLMLILFSGDRGFGDCPLTTDRLVWAKSGALNELV